MIHSKIRVVAGIAAVVASLGTTPARADATDTCLDYAAHNDMMKAVPAANREKWCGCVVGKFAASDDEALSDVFDAQEAEEARGHAFIPSMLPPDLVPVGNRYTEVLGQCLAVLLGQ